MKTVLDTLEWVKAKAERQARIKELAEAQADLAAFEKVQSIIEPACNHPVTIKSGINDIFRRDAET